MKITFSIDDEIPARARKKAKELGKSLNQLIREYLQSLGAVDDAECSIREFERLSGFGAFGTMAV